MADELDLVNRDPNNLNDHLQISFDDILGEPEGIKSHDCVWRNSYRCYRGGKNCCYMFLTFLCGLPLALCWGCEFAMITFQHVWQITPCLRVFMINLGCAQKFIASCVNCCLAPICENCGLFFSNVKVTNSN